MNALQENFLEHDELEGNEDSEILENDFELDLELDELDLAPQEFEAEVVRDHRPRIPVGPPRTRPLPAGSQRFRRQPAVSGPPGYRPKPPRGFRRYPRSGFVDEPVTCICPEPTCPEHGEEYIRWVQSALNSVLGLRLPVNGVMGPETRSAVRSFQEREGLPVDGIVGPDSERALIAARGGKSPQAGAPTPAEPGMTEPAEQAATPPGPRMTEPAPTSSAAEFDFEWEGTLEPEIATPGGPVYPNRLARRMGWANGHEVEGYARDRFGTEWEWSEEKEQESENRPVAGIDWCQMRQTIARIARAEERRWTRPDGSKFRENHPSRLPILESYWRTVPNFTTAAAAAAAARESANNTRAWSAAFICFVMHTAGVRQVHGFEFSQRHITYIVGALRNRERSDQNRVFWLADSIELQSEAAPETGDLLCFNRLDNGRMTQHSYYSLRRGFWLGGNQNREPTGSSHCSIVVAKVERNGRWLIQTIGGNESAAGSGGRGVTVGLREIPLDRFGGIPNPQAHNIFGIIKLMGC